MHSFSQIALWSGILAFLPMNASNHGDFIIAQISSINVKNYPPELHTIHALYETKCTTCHGEKETVRSPGVLPTYWEQTVEKMRAMPKANFSSEEGQQITDFLIFDSYERRRIELKNQLKALTPDQLKIEQEKLDRVINKYQH